MAKQKFDFVEALKNAPKMNPVGILDFVEQVITVFGKDVNSNRSLLSVNDGLKPSYRRTFVTALKNGSKFMKTASISGTTIATLHPHGDASINSVISALCRYGIFDKRGNHGSKFIRSSSLTIAPSAARYTEARVNSKWRDLISPLMDYVPWIESEMEGFKEPLYLPTPIPLGLTFGAKGIGIGVNCNIPAFTAKSMYEALMADDPSLLKAPFGLVLNPNQQGLKDLWETGIGRITYAFKATKENGGFYLKGEAELFSANPQGMKKLESWCDEGLLRIIDETDDVEGSRLFFERTPGIKKLDDDMIQDELLKAASNTRVYRLSVCKEDRAFVIPLKTWIKECYDNYIRLIELYKQDNINKILFDIDVYTWLPQVAKILIKNPDSEDQEIAKSLKIDIQIVKAIMQKSISTLKKCNTDEKLKQLNQKLNEFKSIDPAKHTESIINQFD